MRKLAWAIAYAAYLLVTTAGLLELACRALDLDVRLLLPTLYYEVSNPRIQRLSDDPELVFELVPGEELLFRSAEKIDTVRVNAFGLRDYKQRTREKNGRFRIVCLGGSNTFGAAVGDDQTWPAQLEKRLEGLAPGRFEVWNGGNLASVDSQNVALARRLLAGFEPDLFLFQRGNRGRPAFPAGHDLVPAFRRFPQYFYRNYVFYPCEHDACRRFADRSALARTLIAVANRLAATAKGVRANLPGDTRDPHCFERNTQGLERFFHEVRGRVPMALMPLPTGWPDDIAYLEKAGLPVLHGLHPSAVPAGSGREYFDMHPPAHVYAWYVEALLQDLTGAGLLPLPHGGNTGDPVGREGPNYERAVASLGGQPSPPRSPVIANEVGSQGSAFAPTHAKEGSAPRHGTFLSHADGNVVASCEPTHGSALFGEHVQLSE
jgi:hypothetical protein